MIDAEIYDPTAAVRSLPTFQEVIRTSVSPIGGGWSNRERYLDDHELEIKEESLSNTLCMKTGSIYLGSMALFGTFDVTRSLIARKTSFTEIAGSLASNVPKKVNATASIVFCAAATYSISAIIRGRRDNWNYFPCAGFLGGWTIHRIVTRMNISPKRPAVIMGAMLGACLSIPYICYSERFSPAYLKHKLFRALNM